MTTFALVIKERSVVPTTMSRLQTHPRVEIVDDERGIGNGVIVTLKAGWTFDPLMDNRVAGDDTVSGALRLVQKQATPYRGKLDP